MPKNLDRISGRLDLLCFNHEITHLFITFLCKDMPMFYIFGEYPKFMPMVVSFVSIYKVFY